VLSEDLRNELAAIAPQRGCCRLAEVSALFHSAGSIHLRGRGLVGLHLDLVSSAVARRAFSLLRELGIASEIRTYRRRAFDRSARYQLHVSGGERRLATLVEAGVLDSRHAPLTRPPRRVVGRGCCRGAYVRGALLGGGSLSGPRSPHLELRTSSLEGARFLQSIAAVDEVKLGVLDRERHALAYAKGIEAIGALLLTAGAADTVLVLEERAVIASYLGKEVWPAASQALIAKAHELGAPDAVIEQLERLPQSAVFDNVQGVWQALQGGTEAHRF